MLSLNPSTSQSLNFLNNYKMYKYLLESVDGIQWTPRRTIGGSGFRFLNGTFFSFGGGSIGQSGPVIAPVLSATITQDTPGIAIQGAPGLLLRLQSSEDLVTWTNRELTTNSVGGAAIFQDGMASNLTMRFYRGVAP